MTSHNSPNSFWIRVEVIWYVETGHGLLCNNQKDRESNGKPAKISGDKLVKFIKLFTISLANFFPGKRQKCLLAFLIPQ